MYLNLENCKLVLQLFRKQILMLLFQDMAIYSRHKMQYFVCLLSIFRCIHVHVICIVSLAVFMLIFCNGILVMFPWYSMILVLLGAMVACDSCEAVCASFRTSTLEYFSLEYCGTALDVLGCCGTVVTCETTARLL